MAVQEKLQRPEIFSRGDRAGTQSGVSSDGTPNGGSGGTWRCEGELRNARPGADSSPAALLSADVLRPGNGADSVADACPVAELGLQIEARSGQAVLEAWLLAVADLTIIYGTFVAARSVNYLFSGIPWAESWYHWWLLHYGSTRLGVLICLGIACVVTFWRLGHYARRRPFWQELGDVFAVVLATAVVDAALVFITKSNFSRLWWGVSWALIALLVPFTRIFIKRVLLAGGAWKRPTVVIGIGPNALDAALALDSEPLLGFEVVGFIQPPGEGHPGPGYLTVGGKQLPVLTAAPLPQLLPAHLGRPHVVVALEMGEIARSADFVERLSLHYGDVDIVSPMRGLPLVGTHVTHFFSHEVLALRLPNNLMRPWPRRFKRAFDVVVAALLLALLAPLLALIGWQVARTGRPIFYSHQRIGKRGRPFTCLKFRTMVPDADRVLTRHLAEHPEAGREWERDHKLRDDPRITRFGAWLRRTSLDELPQLINVLRGDMSLVGPRPIVEAELGRYGYDLVYYLHSTPGLTGLWQVSGRNDVDYIRRVHLDCWYVKNWSLWCDLIILFKTLPAVLRREGAY